MYTIINKIYQPVGPMLGLHGLCAACSSGVMLDLELAGAHFHKCTSAVDTLSEYTVLDVMADKGYIN